MKGKLGVKVRIRSSSQKKQIVSLYRNPPADGIVVCIDEMGPLATIPRGGRAWGKGPAHRSDRYHKGNTIQLLAAFAPRTGQAVALPSPNKTGEVVLEFLEDVVLPRFGAAGKLYLIWDNFSAHKRARNLWTTIQAIFSSIGRPRTPRG
jgi:DDE superfamily endonuclease